MSAPKIVAFAGSLRTESFNKKLAAAAAGMAEDMGAEVTYIDLANYRAPIYDGDEEDKNGLPQSIKDLKDILRAHDGLIISTPEYNGFVPPVLINTFSWLSRTEEGERETVFVGKKAVIMAASPGGLGGIRVLPRLRDAMMELKISVLPGYAPLGSAGEAFDEDGKLVNERSAKSVKDLVASLIEAL